MSDPVVLTVRPRSTDSGGHVSPIRVESGSFDGTTNLLVLVHGYNNSRPVALSAYQDFLTQLGTKSGSLMFQVVEFLWPGDTPERIVSTLSYPNQIHPAINAAHQLAAYLGSLQLAGPATVNFVGHSLGCRLILELLEIWAPAKPPNITVGVVALMAAAVVVKQVETGQLRSPAILSLRNPVLFSKGDAVLEFTFPLGETAAGEGFFPVAVGRTGGPFNTWHYPQPMSHNGSAYSHGSYWLGDESTTAVAFALGGAPERTTPQNAITQNPPPSENSIPARSMPFRNLTARPVFA